ncbi:MAG TPA: cobalamin biosynthesis protein CobD [Lachnospiraceae bacterium]|nr:cobalamin biosynthesis protein CobD [Lachnospiraceae bacterium]
MIKLILAFVLDVLLGDPVWLYHPIRVIGKWISLAEKFLRQYFPANLWGERMAGVFLTILVVLPSFGLPAGIIFMAGKLHPWLAYVLEVFWMYQILAMKCLKVEALKVYDALTHQDIVLARQRLSWLVGRDTVNLSEEEIVKATVETVAENTTDGVIAPMLFMAIGGAPLGFAYKAVNTLDSMVGYRNDKYRYFGTSSARADDVVNFIPARLGGFLMVIAAFLCRYDASGAWRCFVRDRNKHLSPNSAQTESACAGALGIQLGGTHDYFGKPVEKPTLGDEKRRAEPEDIRRTNRLMVVTSVLCLILIGFVCLFIIKTDIG